MIRVSRGSAIVVLSFGVILIVTPGAFGEPKTPDSGAPAKSEVSAAERAASRASNAFGVALYHELVRAAPDRNLFFSPYSMSVALTMTAEGARGQTAAEMARVLRFGDGSSAPAELTGIHQGHAALRDWLQAAQGSDDPKLRERIKLLRGRLDEANRDVERLENSSRWQDARKASEKAEELAAEINKLQSEVDRFDLRVANALWVDRRFPIVPAYVKTIEQFYGTGGLTPMDFVGQAEPSRKRINTWVSEHTEGRIKDLIPERAITPDTRLVITNAVYFLGQWAEPFEAQRTREEDFLRVGGGTTAVKLMHDPWRDGVPYAAFNGDGSVFETPLKVPKDESQRPATYPDDAGFTMIELPYKGGDLAMTVIAPRSPEGLPGVERMLTADALPDWLAKFDRRRVDVAVPRFKLAAEYDMGETLQAMGMKRAFVSTDHPGGAEFGGMSASADPREQIYIGAVRHKAWVEVNEEGTEAAAATVVMGAVGSAYRPVEMVPFTPVFRADRPFLFLIRDAKSGIVLFMGRVNDPNA